MATTIKELRELEFDARQEVQTLRRAVFEEQRADQMKPLAVAELKLQELSDKRAAAEKKEGSIVAPAAGGNLLGPDTTNIEVTISLKMSSIPTSLVHLFNAVEQPLVSFQILNRNKDTKRLSVLSYVEGYSAQAVDTLEVKELVKVDLNQLPTFFPGQLSQVTELTRATLNVRVEDLDGKTELHKTAPIWLLARTTAPLQVKDPSTGEWRDMTRYLGAFVTPNAPPIMKYLRSAVEKHPQKRLVGYQVSEEEVKSQVRAIYEALSADGVTYVNSVIDFTPESGSANQRVRLPRESLGDREANCIDGTLLIASLLEAISLNPAIVVIPGHAFVAWETNRNSGKWSYLETTMVSTHSFDDACARADSTAKSWLEASGGAVDTTMFRRWPLRDLRAQGITPLE